MTPEPLATLGFRASAIVVAAGTGTRLGASARKAFIPLAGTPMVLHTVRAVAQAETVNNIVVVVGQPDVPAAEALFARKAFPKVSKVVSGGAERQDSVYAGLQHASDAGIVAVHDGARPLVSAAIIDAVVRAAAESGAASAGLPMRETVKEVSNGIAAGTVDRNRLWAAHTPQAFRAGLLRDAHERARAEGFRAPDDAALVERLGHPVQMVEDSPSNFKITVPDDLVMAESLLRTTPPQVRHGIGIDAHRLVMGRRLVLGGVHVPFELGLEGHSDADALTHAVIDAVLGAAGLGDIGQHFPEEPKNKDADSIGLLREVVKKVKAGGWRVLHVDSVILAEAPKLAPHIDPMRRRLAGALELDPSAVNVKAATMEGLGAIGRGEGIVCHAIATLGKRE